MDLAAPPAGTDPTPLPGPPPVGPIAGPTTPRIVGGVAGLLGDRLGIDPLWVRIGFVLLALAGGIGVLVYAGLWLVLLAGRPGDSRLARCAGAAILLGVLPLALHGGGLDLLSGPLAIILLLGGLALALWQPRAAGPTAGTGASATPLSTPMPPPAASSVSTASTTTRQRPPGSVLGRAVLGTAIVVGAVGALIDHANGGRLHPEQWLGLAAVVCGAGLVVGTVRGRARWLVVPALAFAAAGYLAAPMGRLGIGTGDAIGDRTVWIGEGAPGGVQRHRLGIGDLDIELAGVPAGVVTIDARTAIGDVRVRAAADVTVEVRGDVDDGTVRVAGDGPVEDGVVRLGPGERPDVVVDARVGRGDVVVGTYDATAADRPVVVPDAGPPIDVGPLTWVTEGVAATSDGWFVLADGAAVLDGTDEVVVGQAVPGRRGVTVIPTPAGDFQLLPRSLLITPFGEVVDLQSIRRDLVADVAPGSTPPASTTAGPTTTTGG